MRRFEMSVFKDTKQMYEVLGTLFERLLAHPDVGPKLIASGIRVRFYLTEPDGEIYVSPKGVVCGTTEEPADVEMTMRADVAHAFWLRRVNLPAALAKREITAKGPVANVLKLLPLLKPAYEMYPSICAEKGIEVE
jgi:hypothetical protein